MERTGPPPGPPRGGGGGREPEEGRAVDDEQRLRDAAERDQLWASLRALLPEVERLAAGQWDGSERELQLARVLAGVVAAELRFRAADAEGEP